MILRTVREYRDSALILRSVREYSQGQYIDIRDEQAKQ